MSIKSIILAAGVCLGLSSPASMAQTPNGGNATIRYQTFDSSGDLLFRIMELKFCKTYGLQCQPVKIVSGPLGVQALLGDSLEVSYSSTDAGIRAVAAGADVRVVLGLGDRLPVYLVARNDLERPNKDKGYPAMMQDFKGKKIGVPARGAGTELFFNLLLRDAGMTPADVTFVAVGGPPTAFGSLSSKLIDASVNIPPLAEICGSGKICSTILDFTDPRAIKSINDLVGTGITAIMKREYITKNPKVVEAFLAAANASNEWMKNPANFEELLVVAKKSIPLNVENADELLRSIVKIQVRISEPRISPRAMQAYIDMLQQAGQLPRVVKPADIISEMAPLSR